MRAKLSIWQLHYAFICVTAIVAALPTFGQEEYIVQHSNGMLLGPGVLSETDTISTSSFQQGGGGEIKSKSIGVMDDGLRLTYFNLAPINASWERSTAPVMEQIDFPSAAEVARAGNAPSILQILGVSAFNEYGRRTFSFLSPRGRVDVLQGITLLTPKYAKLEILNTESEKFVWDTRIATSSIPADELEAILKQALGMANSGDWLRLVRFYTQAERYGEAQKIMSEALQKFPSELASQRPIQTQLDQLFANQKFEEIKLRREAGQHLQAAQFLGAFPVQSLPVESQVKLQSEVDDANQRLALMGDISEALKFHASQLPEPDQQVVAPVVEEILGELSHNTVARLADFQRLRSDNSTPNENKVALAISGWVLGSGAGLDNFAVAKSLLRVRNLVVDYLNEADAPRRQQILGILRSEEGAQPPLLAKLLATMKPPQPPPPTAADDPPGLYRVNTVDSLGSSLTYLVQVPPEYDPNRKYPCVLALPGTGDLPELEINAWCGIYSKLAFSMARAGYATRYGYIVVSPAWMQAGQTEYQYTEGEHDRVLKAYRDALRKFSIDSDRVFISGHFDGATAAWDIAVSHPDLWAGAVMLSPGADKYIVQYDENVQGKSNDQIPLGTYIVYGQLDGKRVNTKLGTIATNYLRSSRFDSLVVEYRGRGSGLFLEELPRIFEWMELSSHRRIRVARNIEVKTMRSGDRFFYWLEAPALLPNVAGSPYQFDPTSAGSFQANVLDINGVSVSRIPSPNKMATIWFSPEMVDFSRPVTVAMSGRRRSYDLAPDIGVMLEDVRTRADRQHVFWQKVDIQ
ncbi:MAG: hypothetical protein NXI32_14980 [bacterium]|nr:hypothetical protein [bacterium]